MDYEDIIKKLPYTQPFLFVDELLEVSEKGCTGTYTYRANEFFYKGHFKDNPITPGVILTETMAQIGLVCLGVYLLKEELLKGGTPQIALSSNQMDFYLPVYPEEKVTVISEKEYFRFNKLKCHIKMLNSNQELVCKGVISGMIITK
jgi:3-hydroxyacyl-[acyl-carrier-protein] dehydratase